MSMPDDATPGPHSSHPPFDPYGQSPSNPEAVESPGSPGPTPPSAGGDANAPAEPEAAGVHSGRTSVRGLFDELRREVAKVYVGQDEFVQGALVALFSGGHVLIESVPGLGKTLLVRVFAQVLGCKFQRIQFTPDLMPSDITGQPILDMRTQEFVFRPGPVFTQLLLADEINRSPAKTHAALLEIMQERRVTVDGKAYALEPPFLVLATQNPIESEGTYNLPEAQLDRFQFKLLVEYPDHDEESAILRLHCQPQEVEQRVETGLSTLASPELIQAVHRKVRQVRVDEKMIDYISRLVRKTRDWPLIYLGASPRAGIALLNGARTLAAFHGRDYITPDDVVELALPAMRHRVILSPEAEVEGRTTDDVLSELLKAVEVPRL